MHKHSQKGMSMIALKRSLAAACLLATATALTHAAEQSTAAGTGMAADIARGRYMVLTGHCNNCHTGAYAAKQGNMPETEWLLGNPIGFRSEAGTSYASNLRLTVRNYTEEQWVSYAKAAKPRPPMPWWSIHETTPQDLAAMYRYIISLGPAGQPAPPFVAADKEPPAPYEVRRLVR
jgi:mono/diheme cytochrome c family protein